MKITKSLIPKGDIRPKKKKENTWTSNFETINPEKIILRNILQKNSSFKKLKEKIEKESNSNIHEIFSSDESRLKAIKYVINVSRGKENQKNYMNQNKKNNQKVKKNLSFLSCDTPMPINQENQNKIKVKRSQKKVSNKIEQLSPIKKEENKCKFFKDDKPLNEKDLLRDNNMLSNKKEKFSDDSPSISIPKKQIYEITSHREVNLQYIQPKNKYNIRNNNINKQNNFNKGQNQFNVKNPIVKNNFYKKIDNIKKNDERERNPKSDDIFVCDYKNNIRDNNQINQTINNYYIHKQINKSTIDDVNKKYKIINNNPEKNYVYSDNSYDIKNYLNDNYNHNHRKNISHDGYYDFGMRIQKYNKNKMQFYTTETNNFYEPKIKGNQFNYLNNSKDSKIYENNHNKKKNIIRIMNNNQAMKDLDINDNNFYFIKNRKKFPIKKKNNSFFINDTIPIKINLIKGKDYSETEYNDNFSKINIHNNYNNDFFFHKKTPTNINFKTTFQNNDYSTISIDNKEKINNRILVKKRPLKESINNETINSNRKKIMKNKLNSNLNKLCISANNSFNYISKNKNKIIFNNEDEISEYINKKFVEKREGNNTKNLKFSGFILTKKYNGKNISEVRIEDDMKKLNEKLKEGNIKVENELIEIIEVNKREEYDKMKQKILGLENEILKLKQEKEEMTKKEYLKNELIKKLEKEKQNIINENERLSIEFQKIKKLSDDISNQLKEALKKINIENIASNYKIDKILTMSIDNCLKKEKSENKMEKKNTIIEEEKNNINKTPINNKNNDNPDINLTISNGEVPIDSKKSNPLSVLGLSKISEIKIIKSDNADSGVKEIKNNLALLNEEFDNKHSFIYKGDISPFNENDNEQKFIK